MTDHDERTTVHERDRGVGERTGHGTVAPDTMAAVRERQRDEFGGFAWGSTFFGWLTALGLGALLTALLAAAGAALAISEDPTAADADTIGIGAGIAFLIVMAISYFCGGYVAGRMARFDGARQGVGVVLWAIIIAVILAIVGAIGGSEYNVLSQLDLPRIPIKEGDLATGGIIALLVALAVMFVSAIAGGKMGERFHRKVDRHAVDGRL